MVAGWLCACASLIACAITFCTSATLRKLAAVAQDPVHPESAVPNGGGAVPTGSPELPLPLQPAMKMAKTIHPH